MKAVAADADPVTDVHVADGAALERARAAVVEANVDAIADDRLADVALDVVAGDCAAGGTEAGHRGAAEAVAELVADHRAGDTANDRAGAGPLRPLVDRLDAVDRPQHAARRCFAAGDARVGRRQ